MMKNLTKTIAILTSIAAMSANATITVQDDDKTNFDIGGTIDSQCKVNSIANATAGNLNLASASAQSVASVEIWCNTGQASATTSYESENNGVLLNAAGEVAKAIEYRVNISETQDNVNLATKQTFAQASGSGVSGDSEAKTISIAPVITGFEYAGVYSDTIKVTVSYN